MFTTDTSVLTQNAPKMGYFALSGDAVGKPLGNIANSSPTLADDANSYNANTRKYRELAHAQKIMKDANLLNSKRTNGHRTRNCHNTRAYIAEQISLQVSENPNIKRSSLYGVQTCSCIWTCPVCSHRIATQRAIEIRNALKWADENGYVVFMITLTARHDKRTRLNTFLEKFKSAYQAWSGGGTFYRIKKRLGIRFLIKSTEITWGRDNGWHYHYHLLVFVEKKALIELDDATIDNRVDAMANHWLFQLQSYGLSGLKDYAFDIRTHGNVGEHYLTKLGIEDAKETNASQELTGNATKSGSFTIWDILRKAKDIYDHTGQIKNEWYYLYLEYASSMAGENWITWTPKFKDLCGVNDVDDDEANGEALELEKASMVELMTITDEQFKPVRVFYKVANLLDLASNTRSVEKVTEYLNELGERFRQMEWKKTKEYIEGEQDKAVQFNVKMANTVVLGSWAIECKREIERYKELKRRYKDNPPEKRKYNARMRLFKKHYQYMVNELQSRQMTLFAEF